MKIVIIVVVVFAVCLGLVGFARGDGTTISISPPSSTLPESQIGNSFQVNITISNVPNLWFWTVRLNWDPAVLNVTNVEEGPFMQSAGQRLFLNTPPQPTGYIKEITCSLLSKNSVSGNGILATVTFNVTASGQSDITLNETQLLQPDTGSGHAQITHTVDNGHVIVVPEFPSWAIPAIILAATMAAAILTKKQLKPAPQHD
ncbi:MAG TPA: cohesin domain-containing protein [Candidatus Krumholzibacteriaceae bacterium]|jgi:hypothetical protein|nr:cohesin domain-containing protein [Candidatus Krumholzibacteriaceae bacterium]